MIKRRNFLAGIIALPFVNRFIPVKRIPSGGMIVPPHIAKQLWKEARKKGFSILIRIEK